MKKMIGWNRTRDCKLCGSSRCMKNSNNDKMGYCFRAGEVFFIDKEGFPRFGKNNQKRTKRDNQKMLFEIEEEYID